MINIGALLVVLGVILVSMILHELAHGLVAYALGDTTAKDEGRLSINPIKHLDPVISVIMPLAMYLMGGPIFGGAKPVPVNTRRLKGGAWGMALVAIAGPLTNIILAFIFFLIGHFGGGLYDPGIVGDILRQMVLVNLGFAVFNIIPIPPLDGSRLLYALSPDGVREKMELIERAGGIWLIMILVIIFGTALSTIMSGAITGIFRFFYFIVGVPVA